jgi:hypothetical protein
MLAGNSVADWSRNEAVTMISSSGGDSFATVGLAAEAGFAAASSAMASRSTPATGTWPRGRHAARDEYE